MTVVLRYDEVARALRGRQQPRARRRMNPVIPRFFKRVALVTVITAATIYVSDYLWLRARIAFPAAGQALGSVTVLDETTMKNGRVELYYNMPLNEVCVRSLFPHLGHLPCWYAARSPVNNITERSPQERGPLAARGGRNAARARARRPGRERWPAVAWSFSRACAIVVFR